MNHQELIERSHKQAVDKGFYVNPQPRAMRIALIGEELYEMLGAYRKGKVNPDFNDVEAMKQSFEVELADKVIRIYDFMGFEGIAYRNVKTKLFFTGELGEDILILNKALLRIRKGFDTPAYYPELNVSVVATKCTNQLLTLVLAFANLYNVDIEKYVMWKLDYNLNREYLHGKKF